jgi:hypothetical protein
MAGIRNPNAERTLDTAYTLGLEERLAHVKLPPALLTLYFAVRTIGFRDLRR